MTKEMQELENRARKGERLTDEETTRLWTAQDHEAFLDRAQRFEDHNRALDALSGVR